MVAVVQWICFHAVTRIRHYLVYYQMLVNCAVKLAFVEIVVLMFLF